MKLFTKKKNRGSLLLQITNIEKLKMKNYSQKTKNIERKTNYNSDLKSRTYEFSKDIIKFVSRFPNTRVYWVISDQLLRSATSIGANIIEAQASSSKREFIKFFQISLKSANETEYWLSLLKDATKVDIKEVNKLIKEVKEISKMLGASLLTMKGKRKC